MRVGDLLEWLAAAAFVAAGYIEFNSIPLALAIFGVCLVYFAQLFATTEFPRVRLPRFRVYRPRFVLVKLVLAKVKRTKNDSSSRTS